jgi:hypothetical protein
MMAPHTENSLSTLADDAGILKYRRASLAKVGKLSCAFNQPRFYVTEKKTGLKASSFH